MQERMTLSNMAAELGAQAGLIAPDETTAEYLAQRRRTTPEIGRPAHRSGCRLLERHVFDASSLEPQVAAPAFAGQCRTCRRGAERAKVDVAYIGACTGAKYVDLKACGRNPERPQGLAGVELLVAPSSKRDQDRAAAEGIMKVFEEAGAKILAECLRNLRRLRRAPARRGRHLRLVDRAQLQGPHGGGVLQGLARLAAIPSPHPR
jgi:3-isopropylmalate/(R)-2-methylmalate dehydratase large subunit